MGLEGIRETIDKIDDQMVGLFVERMNAVRAVAAWKRQNHLPILVEDNQPTGHRIQKRAHQGQRRDGLRLVLDNRLRGSLRADTGIEIHHMPSRRA
jgi:hypothetical protein